MTQGIVERLEDCAAGKIPEHLRGSHEEYANAIHAHRNALLLQAAFQLRAQMDVIEAAKRVLPLLQDELYRRHWETVMQFEAALTALASAQAGEKHG